MTSLQQPCAVETSQVFGAEILQVYRLQESSGILSIKCLNVVKRQKKYVNNYS
jgi:hypothetical protein